VPGGTRRFKEETMVNCPVCDAVMDVDEDELDEGDALTCEECGANIAVSSVSPLEFTAESGDDDDVDDDDEDEDFDEDYDEDEEEEEDDDEE
jgi:DNA-directed RNA polymerase subunit M/transcription elongation factor TFIIS